MALAILPDLPELQAVEIICARFLGESWRFGTCFLGASIEIICVLRRVGFKCALSTSVKRLIRPFYLGGLPRLAFRAKGPESM